MKGIGDALAADITGESEIGKVRRAVRTSPTHDEIAQLASLCTWPARRPPTRRFVAR